MHSNLKEDMELEVVVVGDDNDDVDVVAAAVECEGVLL